MITDEYQARATDGEQVSQPAEPPKAEGVGEQMVQVGRKNASESTVETEKVNNSFTNFTQDRRASFDGPARQSSKREEGSPERADEDPVFAENAGRPGDEDEDGGAEDGGELSGATGLRSSSKGIAKPSSQYDRKNIVKNFVKAFRSFVHCVVENSLVQEIKQLRNGEELEQFRRTFEDWISARNFNNSLIIDLMSNQYSDLFDYFLKERAEDWISQSKILNKSSHFQALREYHNIITQERGLSKVRVLKFRKNRTKEQKLEEC